MNFKNIINSFNDKKVKIFVDMDGVLADYIVEKIIDYSNKRPLTNNIKLLKEISNNENIDLYILSVSRTNKGVIDKNNWLDKYASFFKKENRIIISKEENLGLKSSELKANYLKNIKDECLVVLIDDDPLVLKKVNEECSNIILLKDCVFVD
ncbi:MAG: hypothetical protein IJ574_04445 [Bacilli bacterium]|nr:hypothetical protein [Bacilli bacterium]